MYAVRGNSPRPLTPMRLRQHIPRKDSQGSDSGPMRTTLQARATAGAATAAVAAAGAAGGAPPPPATGILATEQRQHCSRVGEEGSCWSCGGGRSAGGPPQGPLRRLPVAGGAAGVADPLRERGAEPRRPRGRPVGDLQRRRRRAVGELRRGLPLRPVGRDPRRA
eukprot:gene5497-biopygen1079